MIRFSFNKVWANTRKQYVPLEGPSFRSAKLSNTVSMFWKFWWFTILLQDPDEEEGEPDPVDPDAVEAHALSSFDPRELSSKGSQLHSLETSSLQEERFELYTLHCRKNKYT